MANKIFPSLQLIAARQFQKECTRNYTSFCHVYEFPRPTPNWFKCLVKEIKFISKKDMLEDMLGDLILAQDIQNHLGIPSVLIGDFCAKQLGKMISYDHVVIQTIVKNFMEIEALTKHLKQVMAGSLIDFQPVVMRSYFEDPFTGCVRCTDGHFSCLIYFLVSPNVDSLRENRLNFADEISQHTAFESCKCVGFQLMDGGYIFVALGKEEFYAFTDIKLLNDTLNENQMLCYNNRSEAVDIFLDQVTSGSTSNLVTFFLMRTSHITALSAGLFPVRNQKILDAFIV